MTEQELLKAVGDFELALPGVRITQVSFTAEVVASWIKNTKPERRYVVDKPEEAPRYPVLDTPRANDGTFDYPGHRIGIVVNGLA